MQNDDTKDSFLTGDQQMIIAILFLALGAGGLSLWLWQGDSVYLNMLITGLMNCF